MSLQLINEIWKTLKPSIELGDTGDAAETLVNYLIEEDYSPSEIKQMFKGDKDIKDAVAFYLEKPEDANFVDSSKDFDDYFDDSSFNFDDDDY